MANDENKFLPIFQILDIKNVSFLLKLEMALATTIRMKFEPVCRVYIISNQSSTSNLKGKQNTFHESNHLLIPM